jgi:hypothetical protein
MLDEEVTYIEGIEQPESPKSLMEQLRAKRAEIAEQKETFMAVPGYGQELPLLVRYRHLERHDVEQIGKKVRGENLRNVNERQMRVLVDTLIAATDGFFVQEPDKEEPTQLTISDDDPTPLATWTELAAWMGADDHHTQSARVALSFVFGNNEFAIGQTGLNLSRWLSNTDINVDQEFLEG